MKKQVTIGEAIQDLPLLPEVELVDCDLGLSDKEVFKSERNKVFLLLDGIVEQVEALLICKHLT